jgi:hypothetical protein
MTPSNSSRPEERYYQSPRCSRLLELVRRAERYSHESSM